MPSRLLKNFLDNNDIKYVSMMHSMAFTAVEVAKAAHIRSKYMAKTVILKINGELAMAVVPANFKVDIELIKQALQTKAVELASEAEFIKRFPDCEVGAMPPFGNLYDMPVYVDERVTENDQIIFNAGSHLELMQMDYKDFEELVKPQFIMLNSHIS